MCVLPLRRTCWSFRQATPKSAMPMMLLDVDYQGEEFTIAFNVKYLLETMQSIESEKIRFEWLDAFHGGVFVGPDDPNYFSLIMPMIVS